MGFDIEFITHRPTGGSVELPNPFKPGEMMRVSSDAGLSDDERAAIVALLRSSRPAESSADGVFGYQFDDGGIADVYAPTLDGDAACTSLSAEVYSLSPRTVGLLFEIMRIGNLVALPVGEESVAAVANEDTRQRVAERYPQTVVVGSPGEFERLLSGGYDGWLSYRNQVVGD
jgi:hypothetical protein